MAFNELTRLESFCRARRCCGGLWATARGVREDVPWNNEKEETAKSPVSGDNGWASDAEESRPGRCLAQSSLDIDRI